MPPTAEVDSFSSLLGGLSAETTSFMSFLEGSDLFGGSFASSSPSSSSPAVAPTPSSATTSSYSPAPVPKAAAAPASVVAPPRSSSSNITLPAKSSSSHSSASRSATSTSANVTKSSTPRSATVSSTTTTTTKSSAPKSSATTAANAKDSTFSSTLDSDFSLSFAESLFSSSAFSTSSLSSSPATATGPAPTSGSSTSKANSSSTPAKRSSLLDFGNFSAASTTNAASSPKSSSSTATAQPPLPPATVASRSSAAVGRSNSSRSSNRSSLPATPMKANSLPGSTTSLPPGPPSKKAVATTIGISGGSAEAAAAIMGVSAKHRSLDVHPADDEDYDPETAKIKKKQLVSGTAMLVPAREILEQAFEGRGRLLSMDVVGTDNHRNSLPANRSMNYARVNEFEAILSNPNETKKLTTTPDFLKTDVPTATSLTPAVPAIPAVIPQPKKRQVPVTALSDDADLLVKVAREAAANAAGASAAPLKPALKGVLKPPGSSSASIAASSVSSTLAPSSDQHGMNLGEFLQTPEFRGTSGPTQTTPEEPVPAPVLSPTLAARTMAVPQGGVRLFSVNRRGNGVEVERAVVPEPVSVSAATKVNINETRSRPLVSIPGVAASESSMGMLSADANGPSPSLDWMADRRDSSAASRVTSPIISVTGSKRSSFLMSLGLETETLPRVAAGSPSLAAASLPAGEPKKKPQVPKNVKDALATTAEVESVLKALGEVEASVGKALAEAEKKASEAAKGVTSVPAPVVSMSAASTQFPEEGTTPSFAETEVQTAAADHAEIEIQTEAAAHTEMDSQTDSPPIATFAEASVQTEGEVLLAEVEEIVEEYYEEQGVLIYNGGIDKYVGLPVGQVIESVVGEKRAAAAAAAAVEPVPSPADMRSAMRDLVLSMADTAVELATPTVDNHRDHRDSAATSSGESSTTVLASDEDMPATSFDVSLGKGATVACPGCGVSLNIASEHSADSAKKLPAVETVTCATATDDDLTPVDQTASALPLKICVSKHTMTMPPAAPSTNDAGVQSTADSTESEMAREVRWLRARIAALEAELVKEKSIRSGERETLDVVARVLLKRVVESEFDA